jgi:hypothetical protein
MPTPLGEEKLMPILGELIREQGGKLTPHDLSMFFKGWVAAEQLIWESLQQVLPIKWLNDYIQQEDNKEGKKE